MINIESAFMAFHAYVQSQVRYGIICWGWSSESNRVLLLQKRCIRNVLNLAQRDSCREHFTRCKILTVYSLYVFEVVLFVHKHSDLFQQNIRDHSYNTRTKYNFKANQTNFTYLLKNIPFSLIKIYNRVPENIRKLNYKQLKNKLLNYLIKKAYYSVDEYLIDCDNDWS